VANGVTRPLIEAGDITTSTGTGTTGAVSHPAYESGDLLIAFIGIDDDLTANNPSAPANGPNGETLILSSVGSGGSSGGGPTQGVVAWLGTATQSSGTTDFTWTGSEFWAGRCVKVLAGEFDPTTPLGVVSGYDGNTSDSGTTVATPGAVASWTLGASDGGGAILVHMVVDADPLSGTPSGWTLTVNTDHGGLSTAITQRDADSVDSETVSSVNYSTSADSSSTKGVVVRPLVGVTISDVDTDEDYDDAETSVVITGTQFEAVQGTGKVEISDNAVYATGTKVEQTETAWGDTSITITGVLGSLTPGALWMWVTNDSAERNAIGFVVTVHRAKAFAMSASGNIAASGENTTGQLTAPAAGTFFGGRIQDDENPADTVDPGDGQYLEDEWCIEALAASTLGETYDFRVLVAGQPQTTITVTPGLTIAQGDIDAALSIVLSVVADLDAAGELTAAAALVLTVAADLAAAGELATALSIVTAVTADLDAEGGLTATLPTVLTLVADLEARGELTTALAIALTTAADLDAGGKLEAALPIIVSVAASITDAILVDMDAVLPITVIVAAALDAAGLLSASASIALTVAADLDAEGKLEAALAIAVTVAAAISAEGELDAVLPIVTSVVADVKAAAAAGAQTDAYPIRRVPWTEKPPEGTPLDMTHPMAQGLFFFCAVDREGDQIDLVHNRIGAFTEAGTSTITPLTPTPEGLVCRWETNDTNDAGFNFGNTHRPGYYEPDKLTIITRVDVGNEAASGGSRIISKRDNGSASDNYSVYVSSIGDFIRFRIDGSDDTVAPATGDWFNTRIVAALSVDAVEQNNYVWDMDDIGNRRTSLGQAGATVDTTDGNLCLGFRDSGGRTFDGNIHWVAMWDGPRTATFIEDFWQNPWQIFEPKREALLIESAVAAQTDVYPIRRVERQRYPEQPQSFDASNLFGAHCLWALIPGWGQYSGAGSSSHSGEVKSVGQEMTFVTDAHNSLGNLNKVFKNYGGGVGSARAAEFVPNNQTNYISLSRLDNDLGILFPDLKDLTILAITRPDGNGRPGTADPRYFTQDEGFATNDHDLMIGQVEATGQKARFRVRVASATRSIVVGSNVIQNDALNLVAGVVKWSSSTQVRASVHHLREDGDYEENTDSAASGTYNPRTTTDMALGGTANTENDNAFRGDIIGVFAFDIAFNNETLLRDFFDNPWQVFKARREPLLIESAAGVVEDITAALAIALTTVADITGKGRLDALLPVTLSVIAALNAAGELTAAQSIVLTVAADLDAAGELTAANSIVLTVAADLDAEGKLDAALALVLTVVADVTDLGGKDLAAVLPITVTTTADLDALGTLTAAPSIMLSLVADLMGAGKLEAAANLVLTLAADLDARGELAAALAIVMNVAADLDAAGELTTSAQIVLSMAADLQAQGRLDAALGIVLSVVADIQEAPSNDLDAALQIVVSLVPGLTAAGELSAAPTINLTVGASLTEAPPAEVLRGADSTGPAKTKYLTEEQAVQRQAVREDEEVLAIIITAMEIMDK